MIIPDSLFEAEQDVFKLEAERRLREISKHRELGAVAEEGVDVHSNLNRCLEELRSGFQEKVHNRRNKLVRRIEGDQVRRKQFDQLRDLQKVEEGVRTSPKGPIHPLHRRLVSSVDYERETERQTLPKGPRHRRIVST